MMGRTHIAFGILIGIIFLPISKINPYLFIGITIIGSLLPDIDCPNSKISKKAQTISKTIHAIFGHRGFFHTIYVAIILSILITWITNINYAIPLFIGFSSHLITDGLTKSGVNLLHPFTTFRIQGFIQTNSITEHIFLAIIIISIIVLLI